MDDIPDVAQLVGMLATQMGVAADDTDAVWALTAIGVTNAVWRNSPVEDWHASPDGPDDAAMLRLNVDATRLVRAALRCYGYDPARLFGVVTADRPLPTGGTFHELAGDDLGRFVDHADETLGKARAMRERGGPEFATLWTALHGGMACAHWWGTPWWPTVADRKATALFDAVDPVWARGVVSYADMVAARPTQVEEEALREVLRVAPDDVDEEALRWVLWTRYLGMDGEGRDQWRARQAPKLDAPVQLWGAVRPADDAACPCGRPLPFGGCHGPQLP